MNGFVALVHGHVNVNDIATIVEIGSHDGRDAVTLKRAFPLARCIAIEGDPVTFAAVTGSAIEGVEWVQAIIGARNAEAIWYRQITAPMISGLYDRGLPGMQPFSCIVTRFDTLAKALNLASAHILKVDVEGATYDVLCGMGMLLDSVKAMHIETETFPYFRNQTLEEPSIALLTQHGFRCVRRENDLEQWDSVWIRS